MARSPSNIPNWRVVFGYHGSSFDDAIPLNIMARDGEIDADVVGLTRIYIVDNQGDAEPFCRHGRERYVAGNRVVFERRVANDARTVIAMASSTQHSSFETPSFISSTLMSMSHGGRCPINLPSR